MTAEWWWLVCGESFARDEVLGSTQNERYSEVYCGFLAWDNQVPPSRVDMADESRRHNTNCPRPQVIGNLCHGSIMNNHQLVGLNPLDIAEVRAFRAAGFACGGL